MAEREIRIGNAERDAAMKALDEHLSAGRLDLDEYGERYAKATVARTQSDLSALFVDLPTVQAATSAPVPPRRERYRGYETRRYDARRYGAAFAGVSPFVALGLFLATGMWFWFLLIPISARLVYAGRRGHGWC
jgi:hypothetical protein